MTLMGLGVQDACEHDGFFTRTPHRMRAAKAKEKPSPVRGKGRKVGPPPRQRRGPRLQEVGVLARGSVARLARGSAHCSRLNPSPSPPEASRPAPPAIHAPRSTPTTPGGNAACSSGRARRRCTHGSSAPAAGRSRHPPPTDRISRKKRTSSSCFLLPGRHRSSDTNKKAGEGLSRKEKGVPAPCARSSVASRR